MVGGESIRRGEKNRKPKNQKSNKNRKKRPNLALVPSAEKSELKKSEILKSQKQRDSRNF